MPSWAVDVHVVAHSGRQTSLELQNGSFGRLLCLVNGWVALHVSACQGGFPTVSVAIEVHFRYKGLQNRLLNRRGNVCQTAM